VVGAQSAVSVKVPDHGLPVMLTPFQPMLGSMGCTAYAPLLPMFQLICAVSRKCRKAPSK
jgi:hypothetical protein